MAVFPWFIILLMLILLLLLLPVILIIVLVGRRNQPPPAAAPQVEPMAPGERSRRREAILERLASKELSREEAEQQLLELDNPVPAEMPGAPQRKGNGAALGCGCLVAVLLAIVAAVLLFGLLFGFRSHHVRAETIRLEHLRQLDENRQTWQ